MSLRFLATVDVDGWKIKTYGSAPADALPRGELVRAARVRAATVLPDRPDRVGAFGVGFLIVRDGADGCLALVDWWAHGDELFQRVFAAPSDQPQALAPQTTGGVGGVCELEVLAYETGAWQRHVLTNPAGRDIDGYLTDTLPARP